MVREDRGRGWSELWKFRGFLGAEIFHETLNDNDDNDDNDDNVFTVVIFFVLT